MPFKSSFFLALAFVAAQAYAATIKIFANSAFDKADPFEFQPNELTARVGDILEFHFTGPGLGVLGSNHSVAMGVFTDPCTPAPGGFFSGWHPVNGTSKEAVSVCCGCGIGCLEGREGRRACEATAGRIPAWSLQRET